MRYEFKLIPAPARPPKIKGVRGAAARYLQGLEEVLNEMGAAGWDYVRCERMLVTVPGGFLRRKEEREESLLVFRRSADAPPSADETPAIRTSAPSDAPSIAAPPRPAPPAPRAQAPAPEESSGPRALSVPEFMRVRPEPMAARRPAPRSGPGDDFPVFSRRPPAGPAED